VLFPYTAVNDDELTLAEGQLVNIITKEVEDKGWWRGEVDGKVGVFPDNFVKVVTAGSTAAIANSPAREEVSVIRIFGFYNASSFSHPPSRRSL